MPGKLVVHIVIHIVVLQADPLFLPKNKSNCVGGCDPFIFLI